ncbi:5'-3' exonuclease family protein isoform X2 [Wolffia australiana]
MGIQGLLPMLKSIMMPVHIRDLSGQSVAVDTYSWLHKGAFSCSREICKGLPTSRYVDYCMHRVNLLRHFGVKPILVFDGGLLPMKADQEAKRLRTRKENLERAIEHESAGNTSAAYEYYQKAVDISPSVAHHLIQVLKEEKVDYIVAPYEADAQMAFLIIQKFVDAVITEDSDLIPFGCSKIIYKMDKFGQGVEFRCSSLGQNKELNFSDFSQQMFLEMCILSGCDYLPSLPGMGLKRAHTLIQKFRSYDKVIKHLRYSGVSVPPLYEENFKKAIWTFRHQRVYHPQLEDIVHLSAPPDLVDDVDFLGPPLHQNIVKGIAEGDIDPLTKLPFEGEIIHATFAPKKPYSLIENKRTSEKKRLDLPVIKNVLTNYFCLASIEAKRKYKAPKVMSSTEESLSNNKRLPLQKTTEEFTLDTVDEDKDKNNKAIAICNKRVRTSKSIYFSKEQKDVTLQEGESVAIAVPLKKPRLSAHAGNDNGRRPSVQDAKTSPPAPLFDLAGNESNAEDRQSSRCDISHIDRYTGIAEKSMEKFIAVMASYRHIPSGSRASGLRPPLRDIKNMNTIRSSISRE